MRLVRCKSGIFHRFPPVVTYGTSEWLQIYIKLRIKKMELSLIQKKIKNYVVKYLRNNITEDKMQTKYNTSNVMITSYFLHTTQNMTMSAEAKQKFFYSFRVKYLPDFKYFHKFFTTIQSNFKGRTAYKEFRASFSDSQWEKINGDRLARYLALSDEAVKKVDLKTIKEIIKIIDKK